MKLKSSIFLYYVLKSIYEKDIAFLCCENIKVVLEF